MRTTDPHASLLSARAEELWRSAEGHRRMTAHRFFFGYLHSLITEAPLYVQVSRFLRYVRRFRTVALVVRLIGIAAAILQTGTLVLLATALFLVLLPLGGALLLGLLLTALLESRRSNRLLQERLAGRQVTVLFLSPEQSPFFRANLRDLKARGQAILVVSPFLISSKGLAAKGRFYCTLREEERDVFLIRKYYFFSLRKHVLSKARLTLLY